MSKLADFLRQQKETEKGKEINLEKVKAQWLSTLTDLLGKIKEWVSEAEREGLIQVVDQPKDLSEELLGSYRAPSLALRTDRSTVKIEPVGRYIIGAQGRVDMRSARGSYMLIHLSPEKGWMCVKEKKQREYLPLTESLFAELLKELLS